MFYCVLMYYRNEKVFCMNCIEMFNTFFLECLGFGSMPNGIASMGFWSLLKCNWGLYWGCIIGESFCGVLFWQRKVFKKWCDRNLVLV